MSFDTSIKYNAFIVVMEKGKTAYDTLLERHKAKAKAGQYVKIKGFKVA